MFGIPFLIRSSCHGGEQSHCRAAPVDKERPSGLCGSLRLATSGVSAQVNFVACMSPQCFEVDDSWDEVG